MGAEQHIVTQANNLSWWHALWVFLLTPLSMEKVREFLAEWLWKKWFPKKPKAEFMERREMDHIENRLKDTIQANHTIVLTELREHDKKVTENTEKLRNWLQGRLDHADEKLDNFLATLAAAQRDK